MAKLKATKEKIRKITGSPPTAPLAPQAPTVLNSPQPKIPTDVGASSTIPSPPTPPSNLNRKTTFNPDDTVNVEIGGKTFKLTRQEHEASQLIGHTTKGASYPGLMTPQVRELLDTEERAKITKGILEKKRFEDIYNQIVAEQQAQTAQQLSPEISQIGQLPPEEAQAPNNSQELLAGVLAAAPKIAGGAVGGATIGSIIPGAGTAAGAVAGGVAATIGVIGAVSSQKRQNVKEAKATYLGAQQNMKVILNQVNTGQLSPSEARILWNEQLVHIRSAKRNLKRETKNDLAKFLSDGGDELTRLEIWEEQLPLLNAELANAMIRPDASKIIAIGETQQEVENG